MAYERFTERSSHNMFKIFKHFFLVAYSATPCQACILILQGSHLNRFGEKLVKEGKGRVRKTWKARECKNNSQVSSVNNTRDGTTLHFLYDVRIKNTWKKKQISFISDNLNPSTRLLASLPVAYPRGWEWRHATSKHRKVKSLYKLYLLVQYSNAAEQCPFIGRLTSETLHIPNKCISCEYHNLSSYHQLLFHKLNYIHIISLYHNKNIFYS